MCVYICIEVWLQPTTTVVAPPPPTCQVVSFPHLRDERQNQKDRMYKSESRRVSERERAINGFGRRKVEAAISMQENTAETQQKSTFVLYNEHCGVWCTM